MRKCAAGPRTVACLVLWFALPLWGQAANVGLDVHLSSRTGHASFVKAVGGGKIPVPPVASGQTPAPIEFLNAHGHLFGVTDAARQLRPVRTKTDAIGHTHTTFDQIHDGLPVFAGVIRTHQDPGGDFRSANGHFFDVPDKLSTIPTVSRTEAEEIARAQLAEGQPELERAELLIVDPGWYGDPPVGARLSYHVILKDDNLAIREAFFIDAHTRVVLDRWSMIHTARDREIHDANGSTSLPGPLARVEGQGPTSVADVNKAYDYAGDTYDYYDRAFGRDSIDDAGMTLLVTVRSTAPLCPNAYWNGTQMVFCAGLVTDDIMAHELTHGVTEYSANLIYQNQPGQLNESFSDIFGELVDLFNGNVAFPGPASGPPYWPVHPSGPGTDTPNNLRSSCSKGSNGYANGYRWLIGEDAAGLGAIRDMWSPPCFGDPDRANSSLQTCDPYDGGGVHSGSGIPNHAFAIVTDGKTFNGQTVAGIGPIKAGAVWYRALTVYLTVASDFEDAYAAFNAAATDLIGTAPNDPRTGSPSSETFTAFDAEQVNKALIATEMNTEGACGASQAVLDSTPPDLCSRYRIFYDDFEGGPNGWTVSNTNPPTPYNWQQKSGPLPFGHTGTVWFCDDPDIGNCGSIDESAIHYLTSPLIALPAQSAQTTLAFTHYLATEGGWDGGNVKIQINGGAYQLIPVSAFTYNPYNATLNTAGAGNTNPLAGQDAWTGAGGQWGTSLVNLSSLAGPGDQIRVRFEFGKDGCTGLDGWYLDEFEVFVCLPGDFDHDGDVDLEDFGHLQACFTGGGAEPGPACQDARLDPDADVDQEDFIIFQGCLTGANVPAAFDCAN